MVSRWFHTVGAGEVGVGLAGAAGQSLLWRGARKVVEDRVGLTQEHCALFGAHQPHHQLERLSIFSRRVYARLLAVEVEGDYFGFVLGFERLERRRVVGVQPFLLELVVPAVLLEVCQSIP